MTTLCPSPSCQKNGSCSCTTYSLDNPMTHYEQALARIGGEISVYTELTRYGDGKDFPLGYKEHMRTLSAWQTLKAVLELHKPNEEGVYCELCEDYFSGDSPEMAVREVPYYPCPTADLIIKGVLEK